jgi:asparaginyl-tRNA synthetase
VGKLEEIVGSELVHMDYGEAIQVLERSNEKFEFPVKWGIDLQSEHKRYLTEKHAKKPVVVRNCPKDIKAFYIRVSADDRTVAVTDVLATRISETVGGGQREERLQVLDRSMADCRAEQVYYAWYRASTPLWRGGECGLRPRHRVHHRLRHRPCQRARRGPVPENTGNASY